ncbi:hypothetical protein Goari_013331, partial [Gossypium aridum]|nr:hypothetical protein [Gossypium aridum]
MELPSAIPVCYCGLPASLQTLRSNENPRR